MSVRRPLALTLLVLLAVLVTALPGLRAGSGTPPRSAATEIRLARWSAAGVSEAVALDGVVLVGARAATGHLEVRGHADGVWGDWQELHPGDGGLAGPAWLGRSDAFQVRRASGRGPLDVTAVTVRGGDGLAYSPQPGPGAALAAQPYVPRSVWDPRGECRPRTRPSHGRVQMAHLHHTVMYPRYAPEDADDVVRAICLFHVEDRGFDDLGYNFLVDRYGTVYEGRAGGVDAAVEGAHAAGFNADSFGISVIGDFEHDPVPPATLEAIARLIADRFVRWNIDPFGSVRITSTDEGTLSRFRAGTAVTLPTIVGHRDTASNTLCPGEHLYGRIGGIRQRVADLVASGEVQVAGPAEPAPAPAVGAPADASRPVLPDLPATGAGWAGLALLVPLSAVCRLGAPGHHRRRLTRRR